MSTEWSRGSTTGLNLKKKDTTRRHKLHRERINAIYDVDRTTQFQENPPRVWESRYQSGLDSTAGRIMRPAREEGSLSAVDRNRQKTIRKANKFLADRVKAVKCRTFKKRVPLLPGFVCLFFCCAFPLSLSMCDRARETVVGKNVGKRQCAA